MPTRNRSRSWSALACAGVLVWGCGDPLSESTAMPETRAVDPPSAAMDMEGASSAPPASTTVPARGRVSTEAAPLDRPSATEPARGRVSTEAEPLDRPSATEPATDPRVPGPEATSVQLPPDVVDPSGPGSPVGGTPDVLRER